MACQFNQLVFTLLAILLVAGCTDQPEHAASLKYNGGNDRNMSSIDGVVFKRLSDSTSSSITVANDGAFRAKDNLLDIVAYVAADPSVVNDAKLPTGHFLIEIESPPAGVETEHNIRSMLRELLIENFNITFESVNRERPVFLLVDLDTGRKNVVAAKSSDPTGWGTSGNGYEFRNQSLDDLALFLGNELGEFVLNETNDTKTYNFELPVNVFETGDLSSWTIGLKSIGLKLQEGKRKMQFTVIESANSK